MGAEQLKTQKLESPPSKIHVFRHIICTMISREESDALFEQLDTDGNGTLNFIEAKAGAKKLKVRFPHSSSRPAQSLHGVGLYRTDSPLHACVVALQAAGMATAVKTFWIAADADGDKTLTKGAAPSAHPALPLIPRPSRVRSTVISSTLASSPTSEPLFAPSRIAYVQMSSTAACRARYPTLRASPPCSRPCASVRTSTHNPRSAAFIGTQLVIKHAM